MAPKNSTRRRRRRLPSGRLLVVGVLVLVAFLYYRPLQSYLETRSAVAARQADVARLKAQRARLERQLTRSTSDAALQRDARRIGYVKPGEQLFIIKGIGEWRRARAARARSH